MIWIDSSAEAYRPNENVCLSLAAAIHIAFFLWNPVLLKNTWKTLTAPGKGDVIVVDLPGAESPALPGLPPLTRPQLPQLRGIEPVAPRTPSLSPPGTPPFISRHFYQALPARLLSEPEQDPSAATGPSIPITIVKGVSPSQIFSQKPSLQENRRPSLFSRIPGVVPNGLVSGGGGGHILIRLENPAEAETVMTPDHHRGAQEGSVIEGPLSNRPVIRRVIPAYPAWAEEQGVIGTVRLYFTVTPEGQVQPDIRVALTSGRPELDLLGIEALRQWRFAPSSSQDGSQWGVITFFFSLERG